MKHPPKNGRRPTTLVAAAFKCQKLLETLGQETQKKKAGHYRPETKSLLEEVIKDTSGSIVSLKTWITEIERGQQTSDGRIIKTVSHYFDKLEESIAAAKNALHRRCHLHLLKLRRSKEKSNAQLKEALVDIRDTIKNLQNQIKTVLQDSPEQKERISKINQVRHQRSKSYTVFKDELERMSRDERQRIRFGALQWLWKELPRKKALDVKVYNFLDPGDGDIYSTQDVDKANTVLKDFYDAWSETTTYINSGKSSLVPPKVAHITNMAKICLILGGMKQERLVDCFCESQKVDSDLPLSTIALEQILHEHRHHAASFATEQYRVIRRNWNRGDHIKIPSEEPLPLCFDGKYGTGSYGNVQRYRDAWNPSVSYAVKEGHSADARSHLERETSQLKKVQHRHIVQFVKSYERGSQYGLLLQPAATTDLEKLLGRYQKNAPDYQKDTEEQRKASVSLKPIMLTAFGCLSQGLSHIHGRKIRHKDIKPSNILYEKEYSKDIPARFLWADFGLAYHFGTTGNSKTRSVTQYSRRYAAPERMESSQATINAKAYSLASVHTNQDTDEESEASPKDEADCSDTTPANGRSSDIFSFGCVFLEVLSTMTGAKIQGADSNSYEYWRNITKLQAWAERQKDILAPNDPLRVPFALAIKMIRYNAKKRPSIDKIVQCLAEANEARELFCAPCLEEVKKARAEREKAGTLIQLDRNSYDTRSSEDIEHGSSENDVHEHQASQLGPSNGVNRHQNSPAPHLVPLASESALSNLESSVTGSKGLNLRTKIRFLDSTDSR